MRRYTFSLLAILFCATFLFSSSGFAASAKEIQQRMKNRHPVITKLKDAGNIGENNKGFLDFRGTKQHPDVVNAENDDRRIVYTAIGKKQQVPPDLVGERRALKIAEKGKAGHLFQRADGTWYTK